jgi:O-antigen/teichoic acid export membrane protein
VINEEDQTAGPALVDRDPSRPSGGEPSLRKRAIRSLLWSFGGVGIYQVLRFGFNLILTRLLLPQDFGLMALVDLFILGIHMFTDVGLGPSIIRSAQGDDPSYLNAAWSLQVVRGLGLWLGCCLLAWPVSVFYGTPALALLLPVAGVTALINGCNSTAIYACERHLTQGRLILMQLTSYLVSTLVILAWLFLIEPSVWGLVAGRLVGSTLELLGSHFFLGGNPCRFCWDTAVLREIFSFGKWIFLSTACTFLAEQADRLIIGRVTSLETLGVYNLAVQLAFAGKLLVDTITARVVFPLYSRLMQRGRSLHNAFLTIHPLAAGFGAFVSAGLISAGPSFIRCLFKPEYQAAGWILQLVAVGVWMTMLQGILGCLLWVVGRSRGQAAGNVTKLLTLPVFAWLGYHLDGFRGLILGFVAADLARYAVVVCCLRDHDLPILRIDLCLSALIAVAWLSATQGVSFLTLPDQRWLRFWAETLVVVVLWSGPAVLALWWRLSPAPAGSPKVQG